MTVIMSTLLVEIFLIVISSEGVNGACQRATRDYQLHQGNIIAFYPSPMQDHVLKDTIYQVKKTSSDVVCAVYCLQDESCKSFNYCNDKVCQLKAANYSVNGSTIQPSAGCRHYGDKELLETEEAPFEETPLCAQNTFTFKKLLLQLPIASPMRLEFTVNGGKSVQVFFSPNEPHFDGALYEVGLYDDEANFVEVEGSNYNVQSTSRVNCIGVPVIIEYYGGYFEVAIQGVIQSFYEDVTYLPGRRWFLSFLGGEVQLNFTEPCIDDFNPQIGPQ